MRTRQLITNSAKSWNWVQKPEIQLIDRRVAKDRLGESNNVLIKKKNTQLSTKHQLTVGKFLVSKNDDVESIKTYEARWTKFSRRLRNSPYTWKMEINYERNSLRELVTAIKRILTAKECKHTIIRDRKLKARSEFLREFDVDFGNNSTRQHQLTINTAKRKTETDFCMYLI